ncbi:Pectin lyase fold/virulence factor [Sesbania bispinosa]|nr:Pectin lyase fold/virulence factor [Sesbania bispinosa]
MMKGLFAVLLLLVIASPSLCARITPDADPTFNVVSYGATGDGNTDDSDGTPTLLIPKGKTFMLQSLLFQGPCRPATINIQLQGTIIAPKSVEGWKWQNGNNRETWIEFSGIRGLDIRGSGKIDGQGASWWQRYSNNNENNRPTALRFLNCENLKLSTLTHINSPRNHISIVSCSGSFISNVHIIAPEESPNTDGINISGSSNIVIQSSTIQTGDDCIAINSGSSFINITGISCGPGHGISIGSLGKNGEYDTVEEVHVRNCTFHGTTNGARIKTWTGGHGYARKITFEDIILDGAENPLIIDQQYNPYFIYESSNSAVKVSDVSFINVKGTAGCEDAIQLNCDPTIGCTDIVLDNVHITSANGGDLSASCSNAHGTCSSCYPNVPCLSS